MQLLWIPRAQMEKIQLAKTKEATKIKIS